MSKEDKIRKILVVDEHTIWEKTLEQVSKLIMLTEEGDVFFKVKKSDMTNKDIILLYMVGKKFSFEGKLVESDTVNLDELSEFLGINKQKVASRISELKSEQKVKLVNRGYYSLQTYILEKAIDEMLDKYLKNING